MMTSEEKIVLGPDASGRVLEIASGRISDARTEKAGDSFELASGRVNCHTHIYSGLAPLGMPPPVEKPENFVQILERVWWRLDRALDEATLRASARLYIAESLLAGTTTLIDHHESPNYIEGSLDTLADACEELGMRAVLTFGATERNGGRDEGRRGLAECRRFMETNGRALVGGVVGLHASFTCSDETIREAGQMCRELGTVMHVHMAEDGADVVDAQERGYPGPLERLFALDALPPGSIMAHGVHLAADQVRRAGEQGVWIVQNPRSNRGNEVGYPPALAESRLVALGTDGYPARMDDEAEALREEAGKREDPAAAVEERIGAGYLLAKALFGLDFASLGAGCVADVVVKNGREVRDVYVAGRQVVGGGLLLTADLDRIRSEAELEAERLWDRMSRLD